MMAFRCHAGAPAGTMSAAIRCTGSGSAGGAGGVGGIGGAGGGIGGVGGDGGRQLLQVEKHISLTHSSSQCAAEFPIQ